MNVYDPEAIDHWVIFSSEGGGEASLTTKSNVDASPWLKNDLDGKPMIVIAELRCNYKDARDFYEDWLERRND